MPCTFRNPTVPVIDPLVHLASLPSSQQWRICRVFLEHKLILQNCRIGMMMQALARLVYEMDDGVGDAGIEKIPLGNVCMVRITCWYS